MTRHSTYRRGLNPRTRAGAAAMAVALVAVLIVLLIRLGALEPPTRREPRPTFTLLPAGDRVAAVPRPRAARRAATQAAPRAAPPPTPPLPLPVATPAPALTMSRDAFAATDIGRMARAPGSGEEEGDTAVDTATVAGPGEGPGGARLYNAQWYREPPVGALALYLPGGPQPGWATIACRTEPQFRVGNCRELDESPRGSGLSRALRQAAWQFQVRPPRLGGKPLIGAWVRIRFDFTSQAARP